MHTADTTRQSFGTLFSEALEAACRAAQGEETIPVTGPVEPPSQNGKWVNPRVVSETFRYTHDLFGTLEFSILNGFSLGNSGTNGQAAWAQVFVDREVNWLGLETKATLNPGVKLIRTTGSGSRPEDAKNITFTDVSDEGGVPSLKVDVEQKSAHGGHRGDRRGGPQVKQAIHTRCKDKDNFELIFVGAEGKFVNLRISITTRNGKFWIAIQQVYGGQLVRTTAAYAAKLPVATHKFATGHVGFMAPLYPESAEMNYLATGGFMENGPKLLEYAAERGLIQKLSKVVGAKWNAPLAPNPYPAFMASRRVGDPEWETVEVLFFDLSIGWGIGFREDGDTCFLHFKNIQDAEGNNIANKGEYPVLRQMSLVAVQQKHDPQKGWAATAIRQL